MGRKKHDEFFEFHVRGVSPFPYDMLRYDSCWPSRGEDAAALEKLARFEDDGPIIVQLQTNSQTSPTIARWKSFGWRVWDPTLEKAR